MNSVNSNRDWKDLVERARKRRLKPEEYANPTFMVSNMGMLGVSYFDAIPTPGTAAILAISTAGQRHAAHHHRRSSRGERRRGRAVSLHRSRTLIEQPEDWMGADRPGHSRRATGTMTWW